MKKISFKDIIDLKDYEKIRPDYLKSIINAKKKRRVQLGDYISLLFENRDTVKFQVQEMMRAENIVDKKRIEEEIDTYNGLIPDGSELSATMFIEIDDENKIKEEMERFQGINNPEFFYIYVCNKYKLHGVFEKGRSDEYKVSSVQYVTFKFSDIELDTFKNSKEQSLFIIDHPNYKVSKKIEEDVKNALLGDLI